MRLYDYFRSSASYRVRIGLNWKGLDYEQVPINLRFGEQASEIYKALNAQMLVPSLVVGDSTVTQSLAILEYLEERYPDPPLLPREPLVRAKVRALAQLVACDIHPINNLRVLQYLQSNLRADKDTVGTWYRHWIAEGFQALEQQLESSAGSYCVGEHVTLADLCLVPQVYNAKRFDCDLAPYPLIRKINDNCLAIDAFARARPEFQPDAI